MDALGYYIPQWFWWAGLALSIPFNAWWYSRQVCDNLGSHVGMIAASYWLVFWCLALQQVPMYYPVLRGVMNVE